MRAYLDASIIVALFTDDALNDRAERFLQARTTWAVVVSDFATAEFASAVARRVRTKDLDKENARTAFASFDEWSRSCAERIETTAADVANADGFLRCLDLTLRTPDALNIALCRRASAVLVTFDERMATCASQLGVGVEPG